MRGEARLDLEAEASHADLVLLNHRLALLRGVIGLGEKHAVITGGLLVFADTAGLWRRVSPIVAVLFLGAVSSIPWASRFVPAGSGARQGREHFSL